MKKLNQQGIAGTMVALIIVLVLAIGGVGYYVWNAKSKTNKTLNDTSQGAGDAQKSEKKKTAEKPATKEEDGWLLYSAPSQKYSIRIPDGWLVTSAGDNLHSNNIDYKKGTLAKVEQSNSPISGYMLFALDVPASAPSKQGAEQSSFKTDSGLNVHKYYKVATEADGPGLDVGDKIYNYYFEQDGKYIQVTYVITNVITNGKTDRSIEVERAIKTIKVN